jgi:uracil-DNA glycosylase
MNHLTQLLNRIERCRTCEEHLEPRPVLRASETARLLIVGQAPGVHVHNTGIPWNDASGVRLRKWLLLDSDMFYDTSLVAIIPMGFCYPGKGIRGDLPPRAECAKKWLSQLLSCLPWIKLTLLIGQYAQRYYLGETCKNTLTETVFSYSNYLPSYFPLPHPSPRNNLWLRNNPWFDREVIPQLRRQIKKLFRDVL